MLVLLDSANYLLEVYFWLILGSILLVTLTIIFARPAPSQLNDNNEYDLKEGIVTEKASDDHHANTERKEIDDKELNKEEIEEEQEVLIQQAKKQWALAFTIFGLSFMTVGSIVIYFFEYTFTTFFGSCMIYVGVMSIVKGMTLQLSELGLVKKIVPIGIFFLNFGLISLILYLIEVDIQPWMMMDTGIRSSYLFVIYVLPYLIWTIVPSFNTTKEVKSTYPWASIILKNNLKFILFNFIIISILNLNLISLPFLRQVTKGALEFSIYILMITVLLETVAFIRKPKATSNEIDQTEDLDAKITTDYDRTEEGLAIRDFYEEEENEYFSTEFIEQEEKNDR
jgi:hypothetical protein